MPISARLRHQVAIERLAASTGTTPRGHAIRAWEVIATPNGLVQERRGKKIEGPDLDGTAVSDALVLLPIGTDVTQRDRIRLGDVIYVPVTPPRDPGARGRHIQIDARRIRP